MADLATPMAAFVLGAALARANSCTVASARRLVVDGRPDWLLGLWIAIGWAGLTMAGFSLALPQVVVLPAQLQVGWPVILGAMIMGLGATMNKGCFLGSVAGLGRGDLAYLFTLVGIALALAVVPASSQPVPIGAIEDKTEFHRSSSVLIIGVVLFAPLAVLGIWRWWRLRQQPVLALILVGVAGGTVYACNPDWSYTSGLRRVIVSGIEANTVLVEGAAIAVVAGVVTSAIAGGSFRLRQPGFRTAALHLVGGMLMATGALLVPGGNDTLMLWAIPGMTLYGLVAYVIMVGTIMVLLAAHRHLRTGR
ncbi:YeeE/YedE thiosulfate transporter family protein [Sphingobium sp. HBC34]|uniref:YeeE/YedE thiosulfate transporter family protein n=1 Tax=Sphingobium cyanobacteriorum TaxID=3063954 RepID=A0ABT8ZRU4_9SPHN|nr:YeeE/YedE thiosulfate transporter family protein [Sphingobium sp. HBC34]MDO7837213.1 YeeE/YedE thiosulfate transporter family protein [Sphingobium sp. HBC34]